MHPVLAVVVFGVSYSLFAASLWPCVALVMPSLGFVGTAFGMASAVLNGGLAVTTYAVGVIQDKAGHISVEWVFVLFSVGAMVLSAGAYVWLAPACALVSRAWSLGWCARALCMLA